MVRGCRRLWPAREILGQRARICHCRGLLLTEQRRVFLDKWIWVGGLAAFLIFLPNLIWNIRNDWPFVQLMRNIKADGRDVVLSRWQYFAPQILLVHPFNALLWITGIVAFLVGARFGLYRFLGWTYLISFAVYVALKGKNYYLGPIYPVYPAAGAVVVDERSTAFARVG